MFKRLFLVFIVVVSAFFFVACGDKEVTASGYGLVHGHYVGEVTVTVKGGLVTSAKVEEYFLPYNFAKVDATHKDREDVLEADSRGSAVYYAKYVKVDDILFTGEVTGEEGSRTVVYKATGINNIEEWVKTEANAKKYVEAVKANKVFIADSTGAKHTVLTTVDANAKNSMQKSKSGYWPKPENGSNLGWAANMAEFVKDITGTKVDGTVEVTQENGKNVIKINGVKSGATATDYKDYYEVAKRAYANATK